MFVPWLSFLGPLQRKPSHLSELLPWDRMLAPGVALMKDEALLMTWRVVPRDLSGMTAMERGNLMLALNRALLRLSSEWVLWHDAQHTPADDEPPATFGHPTAALIDQAQRAQAQRETRWQTCQYLSFYHKPIGLDPSPLHRALFTGDVVGARDTLAQRLDAFRETVEQCADLLSAGCESIEALGTDGLATYLHNLITDTPHDVVLDEGITDLDYQLADTEVWGGLAPRLGRLHVGVISLRNFPERTRSRMFGALETLAFPYRLVVRWAPIAQEKADQTFSRAQTDHRANRKGWRAQLYEWLNDDRATITDRHADRQADDADVARDEVLSDAVGFGELTQTILVTAEDHSTLNQRLRAVLKIVRGQGCVAVQERLNAFEAWLGTLPGLPQANVRRYKLSSLNALHLSAWHAPDRGVSWVAKLGGAPLTMEKTEGSQPYGFTNCTDDVLHMSVLGRTGSGKSTALNYLGSRWLRYPQAQWFALEFQKRSARCAILCHGGRYYDFARDRVGLQPLAHIDRPDEQAWAVTWLRAMVREAGVTLTTGVQGYLEQGVERLSRAPQGQRTLTELVLVLGQLSRQLELNTANHYKHETRAALAVQKDVIAALLPFTRKGVYGHLLDADHDDIADAPVMGFALESLVKTPLLLAPVSTYLWHRLYQRFTGAPTWMALDEVSFALKIDLLREQIDDALRTLREYTVAVVMATQNPLDFLDRQIGPVLLNNCLTSLLLPNADALSGAIQPAYEALGLNEAVIAQLAQAAPKHDYLVVREQRARMITMHLTPLAAAICGSSSPEDHALIDRVLAEHGPGDFCTHWLLAKGFAAEGLCLPVDRSA